MFLSLYIASVQSRGLKIVIFTSKFLSYSETFIYQHIQYLAENHEVKVICTEIFNQEYFPFSNVDTLDYDYTKPSFLEKVLINKTYFNKSFSKNLNRIIESFKPDIIHCHYGINGLIFSQNIKLSNTPIFVTFHGYDASRLLDSSRLYRFGLRRLFRKKNIFPIAVSKRIKQNLEKNRIYSRNTKVRYLGIDVGYFTPSERNIKDLIFIQVSRFVEKKGHSYTLKAFSKYIKESNNSEAKLLLIGDGNLMDETKKLSIELNLNNQVEFLGKQSQEAIKKHLNEASIYVQHSVTDASGDMEGLPIAIMEAMSMQLPILSTRHSGIPEIVEEGINGYLSTERNVDEFAQKMKLISTWSRLRINREKVKSDFDSHKNFMLLESDYLQSIG